MRPAVLRVRAGVLAPVAVLDEVASHADLSVDDLPLGRNPAHGPIRLVLYVDLAVGSGRESSGVAEHDVFPARIEPQVRAVSLRQFRARLADVISRQPILRTRRMPRAKWIEPRVQFQSARVRDA